MTMLAFDSHSHIKRLIAAGFTEAQAEAQTQALLDLLENRLVTKDDIRHLATRQDLDALESALRRDLASRKEMEDLGASLRKEMENLGATLRKEMKNQERSFQKDLLLLSNRLTVKLGGIMVAGISILAALQFI